MKTLSTIICINSFFLISILSPHCISHQMNIFNDYDEGLSHAQVVDKPIFLLFTGHRCLYNLKLQELLNHDQNLNSILAEDFINVHLYVDDATPLKKEIIINSKITGQKLHLRTMGNKWAFLEREKYNSNIQPLVIIIDKNENILAGPAKYNEIKDDLSSFLAY